MKKIIVTGGLGFIGSNLIELLLEKNFYVINLDKITYSSSFYNTKEFKKNKNYTFITLKFFLISTFIRLLPIKPSPPVTIILFIILFFTLVKTISIVQNLKIIIYIVC